MNKIKSLLLSTHFLDWILVCFTFLLFLYRPEEFFKAKLELIIVATIVLLVKILEAVYFSFHTINNYKWWSHFFFNNWQSLEREPFHEIMRYYRESGRVKWIMQHIGAPTRETLVYCMPLLALSARDRYFSGLVVVFTVFLFARIHFYPKTHRIKLQLRRKIHVFFWGLVFAILVLITQTLIYTIILHFVINIDSTYRYEIKNKLKFLKIKTAHI